MMWFETHKRLSSGSDDEAPASSYRAIAKIADEALGGQAMIQFVREGFPSQKAFGEFLGVGESTVAGWMKSGTFPDYAKRATLAAYYANKYFLQLKDAKRDVPRPKVVKDGDSYSIVRFKVDEAGVTIGEVLARDIPTEKSALVFASGIRAWELLEEAEEVIDHEIESRSGFVETDHLEQLKAEIGSERARTFTHDKLLEVERKRKEAINNLNLDDVPSIDATEKAGDFVEDGEDGNV